MLGQFLDFFVFFPIARRITSFVLWPIYKYNKLSYNKEELSFVLCRSKLGGRGSLRLAAGKHSVPAAGRLAGGSSACDPLICKFRFASNLHLWSSFNRWSFS